MRRRSAQAGAPVPFQPAESTDPDAILYRRLVDASQRCLDQLAGKERIALGDIPAVIDALVDRMAAEGDALVQRSLRGDEPFSLAAHGAHVAILTLHVGAELGLSRAWLVDLGIAALLHDIGMTRVQHLLPVAHHLSAEQIRELRKHPLQGERIVRNSPGLPPVVRDVVVQEHERADGSGYPQGLSGERIAEPAQLVGLLDVYEALTHDRPHRVRLVPAQASRTLTETHRQAFAKPLLQAFLRAIPLYPVDSWVQLKTGDLAKVVASHRAAPLYPTVAVLADRQGRAYSQSRTVQLAPSGDAAIARAIPEPALG